MNRDTVLYRVIEPWMVPAGEELPSSQAFRPSQRYPNGFSAFDADYDIQIQDALDYIGADSDKPSPIGVLGVTMGECLDQGLRVAPDQNGSAEIERSHVLVDFSGLGKGQRRKAGENLRDLALSRGWLSLLNSGPGLSPYPTPPSTDHREGSRPLDRTRG